ncbi:protein phosphatase 2C domain-containing protein [Corynebacterium sp. CCM 9204]|uniref:protein phosphatase 2C domain-containing protein n=1 Tax=Corynebacterium sp. CCM 9204 TaxID=3057616 RepID=UPI0035243F28
MGIFEYFGLNLPQSMNAKYRHDEEVDLDCSAASRGHYVRRGRVNKEELSIYRIILQEKKRMSPSGDKTNSESGAETKPEILHRYQNNQHGCAAERAQASTKVVNDGGGMEPEPNPYAGNTDAAMPKTHDQNAARAGSRNPTEYQDDNLNQNRSNNNDQTAPLNDERSTDPKPSPYAGNTDAAVPKTHDQNAARAGSRNPTEYQDDNRNQYPTGDQIANDLDWQPSCESEESARSRAALGIDSFEWLRPGLPSYSTIQSGLLTGRIVVGEGGDNSRVLPSFTTKFPSANISDSSVDVGIINNQLSAGAVSVKGTLHHVSGMPRQDAYNIASSEDWTVLVIADGVSAGNYSHYAALAAVRAISGRALTMLNTSSPDKVEWSEVGRFGKNAVVEESRKQLISRKPSKTAEIQRMSLRQIARLMATTCDMLIVPNRENYEATPVWRVQFAGDSSLYLIDPDRGWCCISKGKSETAGLVDNSLSTPMPIGGDNTVVTRYMLDKGQSAILCTDGFGDVIDTGARPVGRFLFEAWKNPITTENLLRTASFANINADDDRTAAIVWRHAHA